MRIFSSGTNSDLRGVVNDQFAAGKALADVVVAVTFQRERNALGQKRAEALSGATGELNANRVVGQAQQSRTSAQLLR